MIELTLNNTHLTIQGVDQDGLDAIDAATSYPIKNAWFTNAYRSKRWDGKEHLLTYSRKNGYRVHAGCTPDVVRALDNLGLEWNLHDTRVVPSYRVDHGWTGQIMSHGNLVDLEMRDYQGDAVRAILADSLPRGRGMLRMPIRSGKTVTAGLLIGALRLRTLFLVTSDILLNQTIDVFSHMFGAKIGVVGSGEWEPSPLTVAMIQTINARVKEKYCAKFLSSYDLVIFDECFVAGTDVGGRAIESYRVGDSVVAANPETGTLSLETVDHVFKKRPDRLVRLRFSNGVTQIVTPNHPYWTQRGWAEAGSLTRLDMALYSTSRELINGQTKDFRNIQLPCLRGNGDVVREVQNQCQDQRQGILLRSMQTVVDGQTLVRNSQRHQSEIQGSILRTNERQQESNQESSHQSQNQHQTQNDGMEADSTRREWETATSPANVASVRIRVADGSCDTNGQRIIEARLAQELQNRHSECGFENCNRSGWRNSQELGRETKGQAQGQLFDIVGVDSVEILEPGSDGTFGGLCPDGFVYNLSITGPRTYFADGFLVHNCHHLKAEKWKQIALSCPAYWKIGLSATIFLDHKKANERENIWLKACTGDVVYSVTTRQLIESGWLVQPTVEIYTIRGPVVEGDWTDEEVYKRGIVRYKRRNELIARLAVDAASDGSRVMVMAQQHEHIDSLYDAIAGQAAVEKLTGKIRGMARKGVVSRFKKGKTSVIVGNVFGEGVDIPEVDVVINAEGGESKVRAIQRMRNLTPSPGKDHVRVIDFADTHNKHLAKHSRSRVRAYNDENAFKIVTF